MQVHGLMKVMRMQYGEPRSLYLTLQTQTITYYIEIPTTAEYAFRMASDDRMTVTLNDTDIILNDQAGGILEQEILTLHILQLETLLLVIH